MSRAVAAENIHFVSSFSLKFNFIKRLAPEEISEWFVSV